MRVEQFHVKNQFVIIDDFGTEHFQSYQSIIAKRTRSGFITLDKHFWNYSKMTAKYRNLFLGLTTDETKQKIADGTIKLENLN